MSLAAPDLTANVTTYRLRGGFSFFGIPIPLGYRAQEVRTSRGTYSVD